MQRGAAFYQGSRHRTHWSSSAQLSPRHIAAARTTWFWLHLVQPSSNGTLFPLRAEVSLLYQIIFRLFHMNSTCTVKAVSSHPFLRRKKKTNSEQIKPKTCLVGAPRAARSPYLTALLAVYRTTCSSSATSACLCFQCCRQQACSSGVHFSESKRAMVFICTDNQTAPNCCNPTSTNQQGLKAPNHTCARQHPKVTVVWYQVQHQAGGHGE